VAWVQHWDDIPSNPFKMVVAGISLLNLPFGLATHYFGHFLGFPSYLDDNFGHHVKSSRNFSTMYNEL
jgi:hypothetical protein